MEHICTTMEYSIPAYIEKSTTIFGNNGKIRVFKDRFMGGPTRPARTLPTVIRSVRVFSLKIMFTIKNNPNHSWIHNSLNFFDCGLLRDLSGILDLTTGFRKTRHGMEGQDILGSYLFMEHPEPPLRGSGEFIIADWRCRGWKKDLIGNFKPFGDHVYTWFCRIRDADEGWILRRNKS